MLVPRVWPEVVRVTNRLRVGAACILLAGCISAEPEIRPLAPVVRPSPPAGLQRVPIGASVDAIATGPRGVWVLGGRRESTVLIQLEGRTGRRLGRVRFNGRLHGFLAVGRHSVWVASRTKRLLYRIDPRTYRTTDRFPLAGEPEGIVLGHGSIWLSNAERDTVLRLDHRGSEIGRITVPDSPGPLRTGAGGIWVGSRFGGAVHRIDPRQDRVDVSFPDHALATVTSGSVWMTGPGPPNEQIKRWRPKAGLDNDFYPLDIAPATIAVGEGSVWVGRAFHIPRDPSPYEVPPTYWAILRIDPGSMKPIGDPIPFPSGVSPMLVRFGAVWAAPQGRAVLRLGFDVAGG